MEAAHRPTKGMKEQAIKISQNEEWRLRQHGLSWHPIDILMVRLHYRTVESTATLLANLVRSPYAHLSDRA